MTAAADRRLRNSRVAESLDERQWATIFLTACRENRVPELDLPLESNPLTQLTSLYSRAPERVRSIMKAGVSRAVAEYKRRLYEYSTLIGLAWLASAIRATDAVPELVSQVLALGDLSRDDTPQFVVAEELLSVLATFAPSSRVEFLFKNLLFDDTAHFRFVGTLAIGLVICDPSKFVSAVRRYVERRQEGPQFFDDRSLMRGFFDAIPRGEIETNISALGDLARPFVIDWADKLGVRPAYEGFPADADFIDADAPPVNAPSGDFSSFSDMYYGAAKVSNLDALYLKVRNH